MARRRGKRTLTEFGKALRRVNLHLTRQSKELLFELGKEIVKTAKSRVAIGDQFPMGGLQDSISTWKPKSKRGVLKGGARAGAPHAHLIEYGTSRRTQKGGRYTGIGPPMPYMRPAVASIAPEISPGLKKATQEAFKKAKIGDRFK